MSNLLAEAFRALIGTLHSHIDPQAVEHFAGVLEHVEQRVADLEIAVTGKVATYVEKVIEPPVAATSTSSAITIPALDPGTLAALAQLAQLGPALANLATIAATTPPAVPPVDPGQSAPVGS